MYQLLSKQYHKTRGKTFARCPRCKQVYKDDLLNYGSVCCPQCKNVALERGLTKDDVALLKLVEKGH